MNRLVWILAASTIVAIIAFSQGYRYGSADAPEIAQSLRADEDRKQAVRAWLDAPTDDGRLAVCEQVFDLIGDRLEAEQLLDQEDAGAARGAYYDR